LEDEALYKGFLSEIGRLAMPTLTDNTYSNNDNRDENGCSASPANRYLVLEYSDFENDIDFENGLAAGQYLIDYASNLNADPESDIPETQWDRCSAQDTLIPTADTNTEHGSSSRGLQCSLQFGGEVHLPSFPV
jgi:hypothetical protein